jgi:hypothetical protein
MMTSNDLPIVPGGVVEHVAEITILSIWRRAKVTQALHFMNRCNSDTHVFLFQMR